jgi:hypothetical protein
MIERISYSWESDSFSANQQMFPFVESESLLAYS